MFAHAAGAQLCKAALSWGRQAVRFKLWEKMHDRNARFCLAQAIWSPLQVAHSGSRPKQVT